MTHHKIMGPILYFLFIVLSLSIVFVFALVVQWSIENRHGGQMLEGGTSWKALTIAFRDARDQTQSAPVKDIEFRNMDPFLPITIVIYEHGRDSTKTLQSQDDWVRIRGMEVDSLIIQTSNLSHSARIDDLSFTRIRTHKINFDQGIGGKRILTNSQLLSYQVDDVNVSFDAYNAVPTVIRGVDMIEIIGQKFADYSNAISTVIILLLLFILLGTMVYFSVSCSQISRERKAINEFLSRPFEEYSLDAELRDEEIDQIFLSSSKESVPDSESKNLKDKISQYLTDSENHLSENLGLAGLLALSLGLLGTIIGMIDAFKILEDTMKVGAGPAQTQLKMAHYITFALITTAIGFIARIFCIVLLRFAKGKINGNRAMINELDY